MTPLAEAQTVVQQQLAEHGACSPLELLLATNQLDYDDYQAWRRGERATLDDALVEGTGSTRQLAERVQDWAQRLNLEQQAVALLGIDDNAGTELRASRDARLDQLLRTEFHRTADRSQLDLFLDTEETAAVNDVVAALASQDAKAARARLARLGKINPHHWAIADANTLIDALQTAPPRAEAASERLTRLENRWLPAASAVLRSKARDFLAPIWRELGAALEGAPFEASQPRRHAAWAYLNGLDWANVRQSVRNATGYQQQPTLLGWLAEAQWRLRDSKGALASWFAVCWQAPDHFTKLIGEARFPAAALKNAWDAASDADIEPPVTAPWFPAWVVLEVPGTARVVAPSDLKSDPARAFNALVALAAEGNDRQEMDNRRTLQALHPGLLSRYLDALDA